MYKYNKITWFQNHYRISKISEFRKLVNDWFTTVQFDFMSSHETPESEEARRKINLLLREIQLIVASSFVSDEIYYSPPPAVGWFARNISLLANVFSLNQFRLGKKEVFDVLDKSMGVYGNDTTKSILRTVNPFFWLWLFFDWLIDSPFRILHHFWIWEQSGIHSNIFVKTFKIVGSVLLWVLTALVSIKELWQLEVLKKFLHLP